jgi:GT2 family glycosyltransferase
MSETVSVVVVNYNGIELIKACFESLCDMNTDSSTLELIMVDNLSTDNSVNFIKERYPQVKIIKNDVNNFTKALNIGVENAIGEYIAFLNNDTVVDKEWINGLLKVIKHEERIGAVQSKILFFDRKTVNSAGGEEIEDFYFRDIGFGEKDSGQYAKEMERKYISGGAVLYSRQCLAEVGQFDEDYVMFFEDIDYSIRCRDKGWKLFYSPSSIVYHKYHGSTSTELCEYFCSRNRLMLLAKRFPYRFVNGIRSSHTYLNNQYDRLYWDIMHAAKKLVEHNNTETAKDILRDLKKSLVDIYGISTTYIFFKHLEVVLGLRKIRIGIYDHAFHFAGGGQRYIAKAAEILQDIYDVTYIANKDSSLEKYREWFGIDLSRCSLKVIKLPFYENIGGIFIDEVHVSVANTNYFDPISRESVHYDIFLNANMLSRVEPRSPLSIFMCHFPDQDIGKYFSVHRYDYLITNGEYTSFWVEKKWGIIPTIILYPPVDMYNSESSPDRKEKIILSVARFEVGGSKKQLEMIRAFHELSKTYKVVADEWNLVLVGGNHDGNPYFIKLLKEIKMIRPANIVLKPNLANDEVRDLYQRASIFWHACGLSEFRPHLIEHFGMTTVEAMQNFCVPIVIDGGGQREIVEHGKIGFRFDSIEQLKEYTLKVIRDDELRKEMARNAYEKSHEFNSEIFRNQLLTFMQNVENRLRGGVHIGK